MFLCSASNIFVKEGTNLMFNTFMIPVYEGPTKGREVPFSPKSAEISHSHKEATTDRTSEGPVA